MTALTKFIISSIISYFGSLSPAEPAFSGEHNILDIVQKQTTSYVFIFPKRENSVNYTEFTCLGNNFLKKC